MCEKRANVETAAAGPSHEAGRQLFAVYGQNDPSPVLTWLPIFLGLLASALVALAFCPVPRSQTVSAARALFLAITDVLATVAAGAGVLAASGTLVARRRRELSVWRVWLLFASVAAWMTPMVAFYKRDSLWAVSAAFVFSAFGSRLIYRYHLASGARDMAAAEPQLTELSHARRLMALTFAALLLQLGAVFLLASMAHPATMLIGSASIVISFFQQTATALNQSQLRPRLSKAVVRLSIPLGLAIILVGASLTPYLRVQIEDASSADTSATTEHSMAKPGRRSTRAKASFLQSAGSFLRRLLADNPQPSAPGGHGDRASSARPYRALQALFGEGKMVSGSESSSLRRTSNKSESTVLVAGDAVPGIILRPKVENYVTIVPALPTRRVFDGKPNERRADPFSIPFFGAYWFFRAAEKRLPAGAVEIRGDPAATEFKTTDFSPISMEARQNFGSLIDLSCYKAIELLISNGDRRPGTVRVELILTNTTLPGEPHQSLGIAPVNSTLHWFPGDSRPPVKEVLSFRMPAQAAIQRFDEATIRFELGSPRERWSAEIAIEKFGLIPRGL